MLQSTSQVCLISSWFADLSQIFFKSLAGYRSSPWCFLLFYCLDQITRSCATELKSTTCGDKHTGRQTWPVHLDSAEIFLSLFPNLKSTAVNQQSKDGEPKHLCFSSLNLLHLVSIASPCTQKYLTKGSYSIVNARGCSMNKSFTLKRPGTYWLQCFLGQPSGGPCAAVRQPAEQTNKKHDLGLHIQDETVMANVH